MNFEDIIKDIPQNLSKMEKARYIYINLCKQVSYNPNYIMTHSLDDKRIIFDEDVQLEKWTKNEVICSTISKLYQQLLDKVGISSEVIYMPGGEYLGHMFVSFEIDGKNYYADPTHDILKSKKGFQTKCFGTMPYQSEDDIKKNGDKYAKFNFTEISKEELKEIDDSIRLYI